MVKKAVHKYWMGRDGRRLADMYEVLDGRLYHHTSGRHREPLCTTDELNLSDVDVGEQRVSRLGRPSE